MKITDPGNINAVLPQNKKNTEKSQGTEPGKFNKLLNEKIEKLDTSESRLKASASPGIPKAPCVWLDQQSDKAGIISRVADFLNIIEEYTEGLSDPDISLKDISPLVAKIETEKLELQNFSDALSPEDQIKPIVDEALIRATVEVIKFNRGDYINS